MSYDAIQLKPLTIYPRHKDFREPMRFLQSLYERPDYQLENRGAIVVQVPRRFIHPEPPEVDQTASLSWVVEQHLRPDREAGMWLYSDIDKQVNKYTVASYLSKIGDLDRRCDVENFFADRESSRDVVLDACYMEGHIFTDDEPTLKDVPEWNFSNVNDLMEEAGWGQRTRGFFISNAGSVTALSCSDTNLGLLYYMHWGAPKIWTVVPPKYFRTLRNCFYQLSPKCFNECPAMHFFSGYMEASFLERHRIPFVQFEQHPGQMVVVSYQSHFESLNTGVHIGESCNYAEVNWLRYAMHQVRCKKNCQPIDNGEEMREYGFTKYLPGVNAATLPDPTENGKWYCARDYLPRDLRGMRYEQNEHAFLGLPEDDEDLSQGSQN
ncbi:probable lysine-specific demethylase 4B [Paramacrobiotus metropolitanus]|uniref:probable lysine-specific demethylase 4B n=1 Tax=Paramacrobiotus metropolitanus TaxID=2943436 RepID=UPI002445DF20|nr:probable lysine-specific demethylase 4B [Paramacrobiotus metropolitanus]